MGLPLVSEALIWHRWTKTRLSCLPVIARAQTQPMSRLKILSAFALAMTLLTSNSSADFPGAKVVDYFGYDDSIELSNDVCTVKLTPSVGGKIMSYQLNGKEALEIIPEEAGYRYDPDSEERIFSGGGRFDFGLEARVPPRKELWVGPWQGEITGPRQATLTSPEHEGTGIQVIRVFTLARSGSHLSCEQILVNISDETKRYNHWSRTFGKGGGIVVIPLSDWSRYHYHYAMYEPEGRINIVPENDTISIRDNCLVITGAPEFPKLGMDSMEGWFSYLIPNDLLFVKKYPVFPNKLYGERIPMTISIWYVENFRDFLTATELEPIGPLETIAPGERVSFTEEWYLEDYVFPEDRDSLDIKDLVKVSKATFE